MDKKTITDALKHCADETPNHCKKCPYNKRGSAQCMFGFATPQAIYKWLRGVSLPCVDNLVVLADILGCSVDDILIVKNTKGQSISVGPSTFGKETADA